MQDKNRKKPDMTYRLKKLERKLKSLDHTIPDYELKRNKLEKELQLVSGELPMGTYSTRLAATGGSQARASAKSPKTGRMSVVNRNRRKRTRPKGNSKTANPIIPKASALPNLLTKDPISTIGNIRTFCKQCLKYIQQADKMMDTLFVTSNSLKESGVWSKLVKDKGKNLSTGDLTNILIALMNSPAGGDLLKRMGSNSSDTPSSNVES